MFGLMFLRALKKISVKQSARVFLRRQSVECLAVTKTIPRYFVVNCQGLTPFRTLASTKEIKDDKNGFVLDSNTYDRICTATLDGLCEYFEELTENSKTLRSSDVTYGDGVLTVKLGPEYGTYVINRQTPNKQIWLSSPTSGPKRYDFVETKAPFGRWIYKHSGESMHELLQRELQEILRGQQIDFSQLPYGR